MFDKYFPLIIVLSFCILSLFILKLPLLSIPLDTFPVMDSYVILIRVVVIYLLLKKMLLNFWGILYTSRNYFSKRFQIFGYCACFYLVLSFRSTRRVSECLEGSWCTCYKTRNMQRRTQKYQSRTRLCFASWLFMCWRWSR